MSLAGVGVWDVGFRVGDRGEIAEAATEIEELGYTALWFPDFGGDAVGTAATLLGATQRTVVASGVLNVWMHDAATIAAGIASWDGSWRARFVLGVGISHAPLIDRDAPGRWQRPIEVTRTFLADLDAAAVPVGRDARLVGALAPRMLELARDEAFGAHPFNTTPEHTAWAREILGPDRVLAPEQALLVETDPATARELARAYLASPLSLPNYQKNMLRMGFSEDDLLRGGSDRLVDAIVAWGDEETVARRVREHLAAGADHVCIRVVNGADQVLPRPFWRSLAPILLNR